MSRQAKQCIFCQLKELDKLCLSEGQTRLQSLQLSSLLRKLKDKKRPIFTCEQHEPAKQEVRKYLRRVSFFKKKIQQDLLIDTYERYLFTKQELRLALKTGNSELASELKIISFQQACLVAQRSRRLKELSRKPLTGKDLDKKLLELLRKESEAATAGSDSKV